MPIPPSNSTLKEMLDFYGLRELPFGVSPDPRFLYPSPQHREALASLSFGIENQVGIVALIAEPGVGKTTLLFNILHRYNELASTAFVFNTQCSGPELLRQLVVELQIPDAENETDPIRLHQMFTAFAANQMGTKPVVVIVDEAQNLENNALETLRLLSNFEAADQKLLHIILAGQPQLAEKLRHPSLTQLLQRITMVSRLERFSHQQMEECIAFRLQVAGFDGRALFSSEALEKITVASHGIPRELNRICINAMQRGFAHRQRLICVDVVEDVLGDLSLAEHMSADEASLVETPRPEAASASQHFRVGSSLSSHPVSNAEFPRGPISAEEPPPPPYRPLPVQTPPPGVTSAAHELSAPEVSASANPGTTPAPTEPEREDARARRLQELYWERQKALLRAAAQRRQAAEHRLRGLRSRLENGPGASHASYSYQFATGSGPTRPVEESRDGGEEKPAVPGAGSSSSDDGVGRPGFDADNSADKKTGT